MKRFYYLISFILLLLAAQAKANEVLIKGYLKYSNGTPVSNHKVKVSIDPQTNANCTDAREVLTDQHGFYTASVKCAVNILRLVVSTTNCDDSILVERPQVPPSGVVEKNFILCHPQLLQRCIAFFKYDKILSAPHTITFNSSGSNGATSSDSIIKRRWKFGDGKVLEGNVKNPTHTFATHGIYDVCLTIVTVSGCEKTICQRVVIDPLPTNCVAAFKFEKTSNHPYAFRFTSSASHGTSASDSIIKRRWKFSNGKVIEGNVINFTDTFPGKGTYDVCLTIVTASGCEKTYCQKIIVEAPSNCLAAFKFERSTTSRLTFNFSSHGSLGVSATDSIIKRRWKFGDGKVLEGNLVSTAHTYTAAGTYEVCLTIVTASGCEKTYCQKVIVEATPANCVAAFKFERSTSSRFTFNFSSHGSYGATASDSIIKRRWKFGDGKIVDGNVVSTAHTYAAAGTYEVCLTIVTASGCEKTYCQKVIVEAPPTNCVAAFKYEKSSTHPLAIKFNSTASLGTTPNDLIVKRRWKFSTGKVVEGNQATLTDTFKTAGTYDVCLTIFTAFGCEKTYCQKVVVESPTNCVAAFKFERSPTSRFTFNFTSSASHGASSTDSIIKRRWKFGDGKVLEGNVVSVAHTYAAVGTYEVCLTIVTASGCEKTYCQKVIAEAPPANCVAAFKFERSTINRFTFNFSSGASHGITATDSIVKRRWKFGDGKILEGNINSLSHTYNGTGIYEVCLTIVTASGCEKAVCLKVIVDAPPTNCVAAFKFEKLTLNHFTYNFNSSTSHGSTTTDSIVKRRWKFGDGKVLEGNVVSPVYTYNSAGTYDVCLTIITASGCEKTICQKVIVEAPVNTSCKPEFTFSHSSANQNEVKFNSSNSTVAPGDSIVSRIWHFGDGKVATSKDPVHVYTQNGTYNVCLLIKTLKGCSKEVCKVVVINTPKCEAKFVYQLFPVTISNAGYPVKFNSSTSSSNDTIVTRTWLFGDGTTSNTVDPIHDYRQPGLYTVCLEIKTRNGCISRECKQILVGPNATACVSRITFERISAKKFRLSSILSLAAVNDTIIQRSWDFGDGSSVINERIVEKEFSRAGTYTVCLKIKTAKGCESKVCVTIRVEDATSPSPDAPVKIVKLFPAPVHTQMTTEIWSQHNNVHAVLSIYDIYGVKKWETKKVLLQGINVNVVATGFLMPGPYFFKITTMYGVQSRAFYKF